MNLLENKIVFITGGTSGIGKECALLAAQHGARVAIADVKEDGSQEIVSAVKEAGQEGLFVTCDVSSPESVKKAIDETVAHFGGLDVALNNAGIGGESHHVGDLSVEGWRQVIDINLNGVFYCMKYQLDYFFTTKKAGTVINMSSILGIVGFMGSAAYVAAKHGVIGLTQTAALEYGLQNIRVNAICPGFIETPMLTNAGLAPDNDLGKMIADKHAMKRLGKPEEIAKLFVWLASDEASFVNGAAYPVDGGYLAQ